MQHLFVLSVLLASASVAGVVLSLGADKATTISLHAAKHRTAFIGLASGLTISIAINIVFLFGWMLEAKQLSSISIILYSLLMLLILATSWIPDTNGWKRLVHRNAAYGIVLTIPLLLLSLLLSPIGTAIVACVILFTVAVQGYLIYLLFKVEKARSKFLIYQGVYLSLFFVSMGLFIYL